MQCFQVDTAIQLDLQLPELTQLKVVGSFWYYFYTQS